MSVIVTCNAGSSNTKLAAYDAKTLERKGHMALHNSAGETTQWLCSIGSVGIAAIGHRVVHGGREFTQPTLLSDEVMLKLRQYVPLAPLHQPAALKLIDETRKLYPHVPQIACFDTAFHHSVPDIERRFALPRQYHEQGIQRYGFHGLSYDYIASVLPQFAGKLAQGRVVVAHLGGGASACALKEGKSVGSTMGFSTLDGMMMGTRCGALDAGVVLHLITQLGMQACEVEQLLYRQSGLLGVSAISADMQQLLASDKTEAHDAVELFCHHAAKQIAGLLPHLGGLDALVFTGGIGENATPVRERIVDYLRWIGDFPVYVIPTDEEGVIAAACRQHMQ